MLTAWSLWVVGGDQMVQGIWLRVPFPVSFCSFSSSLQLLRLGSEISPSVPCSLFPSLLSLTYSFVFVSFLGDGVRRPHSGSSRFLFNKYKIHDSTSILEPVCIFYHILGLRGGCVTYIYNYYWAAPAGSIQRYYYRWGFRRRGKIEKHRKVRVKRKWWVLA